MERQPVPTGGQASRNSCPQALGLRPAPEAPFPPRQLGLTKEGLGTLALVLLERSWQGASPASISLTVKWAQNPLSVVFKRTKLRAAREPFVNCEMLGQSWLGTICSLSPGYAECHLQRALRILPRPGSLRGLRPSQDMASLWGRNWLISVEELAYISAP